MLESILRLVRVTHPAPEFLVPYALGADDATTAGHVANCATCQAEIENLQETVGLLHASVPLERRIETPDCLDELVVADFVDGRLHTDQRSSMVAHLLSCAGCRSLVKATAAFATETPAETPSRRWRRWSLPVGLAAAAALALLVVPRGGDESPSGLREPTVTSTVAPVPIAPAPGASITRVDRLVWSNVPGAERYRLRLYDREGSTLWTVETADTSAVIPDSVRLMPRVPYFWRVEAQAEFMRWAVSDLESFQVIGPRR